MLFLECLLICQSFTIFGVASRCHLAHDENFVVADALKVAIDNMKYKIILKNIKTFINLIL